MSSRTPVWPPLKNRSWTHVTTALHAKKNNDNTAIRTASSADRASFGCDDRRELTYFGEALLKNQLQEQYSIAAAFSNTAEEIMQREKVERLDPSYPQIFIGAAVEEKLQRLETSLSRAAAADASAMLQSLHE